MDNWKRKFVEMIDNGKQILSYNCKNYQNKLFLLKNLKLLTMWRKYKLFGQQTSSPGKMWLKCHELCLDLNKM